MHNFLEIYQFLKLTMPTKLKLLFLFSIFIIACVNPFFCQKCFCTNNVLTTTFKIDSILGVAFKNSDTKLLKICIDSLTGVKRMSTLKRYHDIITADGEEQSLDFFYKNYANEFPKDVRAKDYELAKIGNKLMLHRPYNDWKFKKYDEYIRLAAPNEKAFVALQKMIASDIASKNWRKAIKQAELYAPFFGRNNKHYINLLSLLNDKWNNTVVINSVGNGINTESGGEFSPVITANDEKMYFCGVGRKDNVGGEDIFISDKVNGVWSEAKIVSDLSSKNTNDAPISISTDGQTMMFFKSGKLLYSQKSTAGWEKAIEFSSTINSVGWQLDGMLTSDGKGLIFSSTRPNGYNLFSNIQKYHGDKLYPSDIYISLLTEDRKWSDPINLGSTINTQYCERSPFLHADMKTLYFSSDGHGGLGKLDVFKSTRLSDSCWNCWSEPVNLGKEINTQESDMGYKITTLGDKAYFSFERKPYFESSILLLLDVSGSMRGEKLEALKDATMSVCETAIQNNSEVSILTFAGKCEIPIIDSCNFTKSYAVLNQFVDSIKVGGDTPTFEAYYSACKYFNKYSNPSSTNKVIILFTDADGMGCISIDSVMVKVKSENILYKTQTVLFDSYDNNYSYSNLKKISSLTNGKFFSSLDFNDLGSAFEAANNDIFNFNMNGDKDIYWVNLPWHLRPNYVSTVSGKVLDAENRAISTEVKWEDLETGKSLGVSKSDPGDGSYFLVLPNGKIYSYYVDDNSYLPVSNFVDLRNVKSVVKEREDFDLFTFKQLVEKGMAIKVNNIFFDFNKSVLLNYSIPELKRLSKIIQAKSLKIEIGGNTDNIGNDEFNQILSEKRAQAVKTFLVKDGCSADSLITVGYGEKNPVTTNQNSGGRAKNRRVEIKILN